jgi:hypothetical protein
MFYLRMWVRNWVLWLIFIVLLLRTFAYSKWESSLPGLLRCNSTKSWT